MFIIEYFKKRKQAKFLKDKEIHDKYLINQKEKYDITYKRDKEAMTSKFCAVRGNDSCTSECIHFRSGGVYFYRDSCSELYYNWYYNKPSCKLWRI